MFLRGADISSCTVLAQRLLPRAPIPGVLHCPGMSLHPAGARQLLSEDKEVVVGAGMGCLTVLCGQELPLPLWVDAPVHPPMPGDEVLDSALLKLGSGSVVCCCCCCTLCWLGGLESTRVRPQAVPQQCTGTCPSCKGAQAHGASRISPNLAGYCGMIVPMQGEEAAGK